MPTKINNRIILLFFALAAFCFFLALPKSQAEQSITSLPQNEDSKETQEKIKALEEKAKTYQQIIDIKQKQQASLNNQVSLIQAEQDRLEAQIQINKKNIDEANNKISSLIGQIYEKEKTLVGQKKVLADLVQIYYEYRQQTNVSLLFGSNSFSSFLKEKDRIAQTGEKIREIISNIDSMRKDLENEKSNLEQKRKEAAELSIDLQEKMTQLESTKDQKQVLISQTRGEENRYSELLARVEMQKQILLGDIDELYSANTAELEKLLSRLEKPSSGLASTSWYYSQKDDRWGNMRIGQSSSLVKDYGCALTSVAMVFTFYGDNTTPANLARQKIFYWDLIVWPEDDGIELVTNTNHSGVNWNEIDSQLKSNHPVIVFIKAKSGGAGHYVVIHHKVGSRYVVHDPYFGANIYLDSSIMLLSSLYKTSISKSSINQMVVYKKV